MFVTFPNSPFRLFQPFEPAGDQPQAIAQLVEGIDDGLAYQTLLGVTGSGKTYTMANVIAQTGRPALVMAPNKTLAAQLYSEMREFFPENAVEYFVSYYDYYQPEAYVPSRDLFIEKDSSINEHIEQMRLSATKSLLERRDTVIVATVSAIYGIGDPADYHSMILHLRENEKMTPARGHRAADGDAVRPQRHRIQARRVPRARRRDRHLPGGTRETAIRIELFDDEVETLHAVRSAHRADPVSGWRASPCIPSSHYVTPRETMLRAIEAIKVELRERIEWYYARRQAGRGAAHRAAHPLRPRNARRTRLLQGHRELLAPSVRAQAGRAAADADRLPAERRADVHRRDRTSPCRRSAACTRATARARKTWSTTASACRRRSTTGRCASTSSRR